MISIEQALAAKIVLRTRIGVGDSAMTRVNVPWLRGIGIGMDKAGSYYIKVNVASKADVKHVPGEVAGVPIIVDVTGDFFPLDY